MTTDSTSSDTPSRETCQTTFESAVAMALHLWQPLSFAVENHLGGGDGKDKRDWFAGAITELFEEAWASPISSSASASLTDDLLMDTESRLLQIMDDEFETNVDDGSAYDVAEQIVRLFTQCRRGQFNDVDELRRRWETSQGRSVAGVFHHGQAPDEDTWSTDDDDDDDDGEEDGNDRNGDIDMDEAPGLVGEPARPNRRPSPEMDEDGFTTVRRKR